MDYVSCEFGGGEMSTADALDRSSLTDKVYLLLRNRILAQALLPGQKVDIDGLAADLGISRTPVKDALNRLASDGLVTVLARRGTFVTRFEIEDLLELLDVRMALEMHAVRTGASQATPAALQAMQALLQGLELDFPDDRQLATNADEFRARDRRFHLLAASTAQNRRLLESCEYLHLDIQMARAYYARTDLETEWVHAEHRGILDAFLRQDGDAAAQAVMKHLERVKASLRRCQLASATGELHTSK